MVSLNNVRKTEKETRLFIDCSDFSPVYWLMKKLNAEDFHMYASYTVMRGKVKQLIGVSKDEIEKEIESVYANEEKDVIDGIKHLPSVIISHYDVNDLHALLKDSETDGSFDEYYAGMQKEKEEMHAALRLNPDFDYGESVLIKKRRLAVTKKDK